MQGFAHHSLENFALDNEDSAKTAGHGIDAELIGAG
jgi:hypothetical protein